jgi:acyl carrier protein
MSRGCRFEEAVIGVLQTLTPAGTSIQRHHRILADLHLLSDDATAMALGLERRFQVKIPRAEWQRVFTVQDTIELLSRYADQASA